MRHNGSNISEQIFDSKEEQLEPLCRNKVADSCSSLGFLDTSSDNVTEDMVLDYLARIIADIYLCQTYGNNTKKESSTILPGINKRTG
jgi:hypothetical protein